MLKKALLIFLCCFSFFNIVYAKTISGEVNVVIYDYFYKDAEYQYRISLTGQPQKSYNLIFANDVEVDLETGDIIEVEGDESTNQDFIAKSFTIRERTKAQLPVISGESIAFIMVDLTDTKVSDRFTKDQFSQVMTRMQAEFAKISHGQFAFNLDANGDNQNDVFGPLLIDESSTTCNTASWENKALNLLNQAGINTDQYRYRVYIVLGVRCGWAGVATLGCGRFCTAFINDPLPFGIYAHELGHNFTLHHAATDTNNDGVHEQEYGDISCPMGHAYPVDKIYNAPHLTKLGWKEATPISGQNYTLSPLYLSKDVALHPQVLKIPRDNNTSYYLSFRQAKGGDINLNPFYTRGVSIHSFNEQRTETSKLITVLAEGESFEGLGIKINGVEILENEARVFLDSDCQWSPKVQLSSSFQSVDQTGNAEFSLVVTNTNEPQCGPTQFRVAGVAELGLNLNPTDLTFSLNPGQSKTINFVAAADEMAFEVKRFMLRITADDSEKDWEPISFFGLVWTHSSQPPFSSGLIDDIYEGQWNLVPNFDELSPIETTIKPIVNLGDYSEKDYFAMHFHGFIFIESPGFYKFYLASDDGSWLKIDKEKIIDNDGLHGIRERSAVQFLAAGYHFLEVGFFELNGAARLQLLYELPGVIPKQEVPAEILYYLDKNKPNNPPEVNLGPDQTIPLTFYHKIIAQVFDPDASDSIVDTVWEKISGPNVDLVYGQDYLELFNLTVGHYRFRFSATDSQGAVGSDELELIVNEVNWPPAVTVGPDRTMSLLQDQSIILTGSASDSDSVIAGYSWQILSAPADSFDSLRNDPKASTDELSFQFTPWIIGNYVVRLTVIDDKGATAYDEVNILVNE